MEWNGMQQIADLWYGRSFASFPFFICIFPLLHTPV